MEEEGPSAVIFHGRYRFNGGAFRPSLKEQVILLDPPDQYELVRGEASS